MTTLVFAFKKTRPQISITSGVQQTNIFILNNSPEKKFEWREKQFTFFYIAFVILPNWVCSEKIRDGRPCTKQ